MISFSSLFRFSIEQCADAPLQLLDTETGSPAEAVFRKLGYSELGKIPAYGLSPTGELKDGTFFYKDLRQ